MNSINKLPFEIAYYSNVKFSYLLFVGNKLSFWLVKCRSHGRLKQNKLSALKRILTVTSWSLKSKMYKKVRKLRLSATFGKLPLNERNNHKHTLFCSRKHLYSPWRAFLTWTSTPSGNSSNKVLVFKMPTPLSSTWSENRYFLEWFKVKMKPGQERWTREPNVHVKHLLQQVLYKHSMLHLFCTGQS